MIFETLASIFTPKMKQVIVIHLSAHFLHSKIMITQLWQFRTIGMDLGTKSNLKISLIVKLS